MFRPTIPNTSGDRPLMVIIRRSITRKSVLDSGSAREFISEAFLAASAGVAGAGDRIGSPAGLFRTTTFSIAMASTASTAEGLKAAAGLEVAEAPGRTILATGWGFLTPIGGWLAVSAEPPVRAADLPAGSLADGRITAAISGTGEIRVLVVAAFHNNAAQWLAGRTGAR